LQLWCFTLYWRGRQLIRPCDARFGTYALSDGRSLAIVGYDGTPRDLRYDLSSGDMGTSLPGPPATIYKLSAPVQPDGAEPAYGSVSFSDCATGKVSFKEAVGQFVNGTRRP